MARRTGAARRTGPVPDSPASAKQEAGRKRLRPGEREKRIVTEAAAFFAEVGLDGRTRDLAARMGVSQALLYRYFRSKDALIDRVYETVFSDLWNSQWNTLLVDRSRPLADRLTEFYRQYAGRFSYVSLRLFMLAGLFDKNLAQRYSFALTDRILRPIIGELRESVGAPAFDAAPMTRGERELAMMLHGGIIFIGIRKFVYQMPLPDRLDDLIALHVTAFIEGAGQIIGTLSAEDGPDSLTVPLLR